MSKFLWMNNSSFHWNKWRSCLRKRNIKQNCEIIINTQRSWVYVSLLAFALYWMSLCHYMSSFTLLCVNVCSKSLSVTWNWDLIHLIIANLNLLCSSVNVSLAISKVNSTFWLSMSVFVDWCSNYIHRTHH